MRDNFGRILLSLASAGLLSLFVSAVRAEEKSSPVPEQASPVPDQASEELIARLVKQLGHNDCRLREVASAQLAKLALASLPALTAALQHPDLEVRIRAKQLIVSILAEDFQRRLREFAADVDDARGLDLPYWKQFKQSVGHDAAARKLFVAMQQEEAGLLEAAAESPQAAAEALRLRFLQMQARPARLPVPNRKGLTYESTTALILVASDPDVNLETLAGYLASLPSLPAFRQALVDGGADGHARRVFTRWLAHPAAEKNRTLAINNMAVANQLNMPESITPALQILASQMPVPYYRQEAILIIGKYGTRERLSTLEPFLQDTTKCGQMQIVNGAPQPSDIQIRDVALAAMIHLSGQNPKDFGFEKIQTNEQTLFNVQTLGFADNEQRDTALKKWQDWSAAQKK